MKASSFQPPGQIQPMTTVLHHNRYDVLDPWESKYALTPPANPLGSELELEVYDRRWADEARVL